MCLISRFLVPMPLTPLQNGFGNGISGLLSGFFGGFIGVLVFNKTKKVIE